MLRKDIKNEAEMARGKGRGVGGDPQGDRGAKFCVCPECGYFQEHLTEGGGLSTPCVEIKCPKCGNMMKGSDTKKLTMELFFRGDSILFEGGTLFKKDLIRVGDFYYIDEDGRKQKLSVTEKRIDSWIDCFNKYSENGGKIFVPEGHSVKASDNKGWVKRLMRENDTLLGILDITDKDMLASLKSNSVEDVSIAFKPDIMDDAGNKYDEMIWHVALTPIPAIRGQGGFVKLEDGNYSELKKEGKMEDFEDRLLVFYEENKGTEFVELKAPIALMKEDWNKAKFSNKAWTDVDKTKLDKSDFLYTPDTDQKSTWKLPYRDDTGKINIGAVKAIWGILQGARGKEVDIPADALGEITTKVEGWRKELGLGTEEETVEEKKTKEELEASKKKVIELEKKLEANKSADTKSLKIELEETNKKLEKLELESKAREKIQLEEKVTELVKTGKLPPAQKEKVLAFMQDTDAKTIELESKDKDGKVEKRTLSRADLLLEIFPGTPPYAGFKEETVTEPKTELEDKDITDTAQKVAKDVTGTTRTAQLEADKK